MFAPDGSLIVKDKTSKENEKSFLENRVWHLIFISQIFSWNSCLIGWNLEKKCYLDNSINYKSIFLEASFTKKFYR